MRIVYKEFQQKLGHEVYFRFVDGIRILAIEVSQLIVCEKKQEVYLYLVY